VIGPLNNRRNRVAVAIANWVLNHVATPKYKHLLRSVVIYGIRAAERDGREGRAAPGPLSSHETTEVPMPLVRDADLWERP
jgi:hypothetical protein